MAKNCRVLKKLAVLAWGSSNGVSMVFARTALRFPHRKSLGLNNRIMRVTLIYCTIIASSLLLMASISMAADLAGTVKRGETTPEELRDLSIIFERLAFTFPEAVHGNFWIEVESDGKALKKQTVPNDAVPASTSFLLGWVATSDHSIFVSATTTHDGRADRRTGSYGIGAKGGTRTVSFTPTSEKVPAGVPFELFKGEIKPSWRHEKEPTFRFRIMAQFTAPR
jgi:hypothetical protein